MRLRGTGMALIAAGLLVLGLAMAPAAMAKNQSDGYYMTLESATYDSDANETTYVWTLNHDSRTDPVSHLLIDTCLLDSATAVDPAAAEYKDAAKPDPTTSATGYKWEPDPAVGATFSLTFAGNTGTSGTSTWAVKKGTGYVTGTTAGPGCEQGPGAGSLVVAKTVQGSYSGDEFPFTVTCGPDDTEIDQPSSVEARGLAYEPWSEDITLGDGESKTYTDIPAGWVCSATETNSRGATTVTVDDTTSPTGDGVVTIVDGQTSRVDVTNEFTRIVVDPGSLRVGKTVVGSSTDTFPFTVACTLDGQAVTLAAGDASFSLGNGQTKTITGIPAGASCTVTETDRRGAVSTTINDSSGTATDGVVTIASNTQATVDFTNTMAEVAGVVFTNTSDELPSTGSGTAALAAIGSALLAAGLALVRAGRRRPVTAG